MNKYIVGIDIGGTSVKLGLFAYEGEIIHKWSVPTNTDNNGESIVVDCWNSIQEKLQSMSIGTEEILGIGVGIPGFISNGIVTEAINIGWKNKNIIQEMRTISGLPVFIENDANLAVLGENWQGAGKGAEHVVAVTLGTGVGGGIISNGKILNGKNGMAGELGHLLVEENGAPCNCGQNGCLETIASATGIVRQAKEIIRKMPESSLASYYNDKKEITSRDIFQLAYAGDELAEKIVDRVSMELGRAFATLGVILNPEKILLGGGVSQAGEPFLERITSYFNHYALSKVVNSCEIVLAELGNDAGIIGAAFLVKQNMEKNLL